MRVASASIARFGVTFPPFACGGGGGIAGLGSVPRVGVDLRVGLALAGRGTRGVSEQRHSRVEEDVSGTRDTSVLAPRARTLQPG
jgi:hypothetical protein